MIILIITAIIILEKPMKNTNVKRVISTQQVQTLNITNQNVTNLSMQKSTCNPPSNKNTGLLAPELIGISGYLNTDHNITIEEFVGKKIVLIDFWTYSCINCQRTLPYLIAWYDKYKTQGLEIIGVHAPEFEFEKNYDNVKRAIEKFKIKYPVVQDNDHQTWDAFNNMYWPAKYLIDINGKIVWTHFGEGGYDEAENKIQEFLNDRATQLCSNQTISNNMTSVNATEINFYGIGSPEIYLGSQFTRGNFGNIEGLPNQQIIDYTMPSQTRPNQVYLDGKWFVDTDNVRLVSNTGKVLLNYIAKNVNIVASAQPGSNITVIIDDSIINTVHINNEDLYTIIQGKNYGTHTTILQINGTGFKLYTFTFG